MSTALPLNPEFGPGRRRLTHVLTIVFVVLLAAMLILGTVQVIGQIAGLAVGSGSTVVSVAKTLGPYTYAVAAAFGTATFFLAWAYGWKGGD